MKKGFTPLEIEFYLLRRKRSKMAYKDTIMDFKPSNVKFLTGFTLVEIMIVVAIIAVIASIAIPSFINAGAKARKNACITNLTQINAAKEQYAMDYSLQNGASVTDAQINGYLGSIVPACPGGGTYTYGTIGTYPSCTLSSQGHTIE